MIEVGGERSPAVSQASSKARNIPGDVKAEWHLVKRCGTVIRLEGLWYDFIYVPPVPRRADSPAGTIRLKTGCDN